MKARPFAKLFRTPTSVRFLLSWSAAVLAAVSAPAEENAMTPGAWKWGGGLNISQELDADYGYVGGAADHRGSEHFGTVTEQNSDLKYVLSPELNKNLLLRIGFEWQQFSFDGAGHTPVPDTLQGISAVLGLDYQLNDQWLLRTELQPGVYSDFRGMGLDDVDAPLIVGASYLVDADLQWFIGMRVDARSEYPVIPAPGVRWKFADDWTLMAVFPTPRVQYDISEKLQAYVGATVEAGTFHVNDRFGRDSGHPKLDGALVDYYEGRVGPGFSWKLLPNLTVDVDGGWMIGRWFDFFEQNYLVRGGGAPYGQLACHARF